MYHTRWKINHYEAGYHYGKRLREHGAKLTDILPRKEIPGRKEFCEACILVYQREYPQILAEIRGIADGQEMPFSELSEFLLGMYNYTAQTFCTCFACRQDDQVIFGRNSDFVTALEDTYDSCYYQLDGCYSFIGNTTSMSQIEDGVNEWGLAAGLTFVWPVVKAPGLNAGFLVRYILENCRDVPEALLALENLTVSSSQTITLADRKGNMAVVESNSEKRSVLTPLPGQSFVAAANDFHSSELKACRAPAEDLIHSGERYQTACGALKEFQGRYSAEFARDLLAGKYGFMCQYDRTAGMDTVWSSLYLLNENKVFRCEGNPSRKKWLEDNRLSFRQQ
ncbi:C45 family autoproteolytic acyltransferase/hydolase [Anaerolentibacter hominis]|uniref:C45 family autoproteolytic acyltransferase/hydolase n=1 Tax=Anaerolentibacter hominis TaxID=3079009 RepID=UPI0031B84ACA